jgi:hypothetical protein
MTKNNIGLTSEQLRQAADLQDSITKQQNQLTALLTGQKVTFKGKVVGKTNVKVTRTPEQRARIAEGQRARWAAKRAAATPAVTLTA